MTILFFSRLFYPHIGGVETHVLEAGRRLVGKGHRVIVVTEELVTEDIPVYQSKNTSAKVTGEVDGIEIHRIPSRHSGLPRISNDSKRFWMCFAYQNDGKSSILKENWFKKFKIWWWLWKHKELIERADIIHCHDVFFWYLPFRFIYPKKPVYITFHGYETRFPPSKKAILIRKISAKLSWGNICVGDYIKKWYGTKPTYTTYGGVGILPINTNTTNKYQSKNKKLKILFIGRLEKDTGIEVYFDTLNIIKQKKISTEIIFLGDGSYKGQALKYGVVKSTHSNDTYHYSNILRDADVVFASSYLSILGAMAAKKLVFSVYDNPLKEDYLKMSPFAKWIEINRSPNKIAGKIESYIRDANSKKEDIDNAYKWIVNQTWDKVVNLYLELWELQNP